MIFNNSQLPAPSSNFVQAQIPQTPNHTISRKKIILVIIFWTLISYLVYFSLSETSFIPPSTYFIENQFKGLSFVDFITNFLGSLVISIPQNFIGLFGVLNNTYDNPFGAVFIFSLPAIIIVAILGFLSSFSLIFRRIILFVAPVLGLLFAIIVYQYSLTSAKQCLPESCSLPPDFIFRFVGYYFMSLVAFIPVAYSLRKEVTSTIQVLKRSLLPGIISILVVLVIWFIGLYKPSILIAQKKNIASTIESTGKLNILKNKTGTIIPSYLPPNVSKNMNERFYGNEGHNDYFCPNEYDFTITYTSTDSGKDSSLYSSYFVLGEDRFKDDYEKINESGQEYYYSIKKDATGQTQYLFWNNGPTIFLIESREACKLTKDEIINVAKSIQPQKYKP